MKTFNEFNEGLLSGWSGKVQRARKAGNEIAAASAKHPMIHHVMQSHSDKTSTMFHKKADADRHASSLRAQGHKPTVFSDNMHPNVIKKNASKIR
jgi:hypothetical protein